MGGDGENLLIVLILVICISLVYSTELGDDEKDNKKKSSNGRVLNTLYVRHSVFSSFVSIVLFNSNGVGTVIIPALQMTNRGPKRWSNEGFHSV